MKHQLEKCMRIVNDIVAFCQSKGAEEYRIYLTPAKDGISAMTVSSPIKNLPEDVVRELEEQLNLPRTHEIEQNYWELSGESEMSGELSLVGMMIDEARVGYVDGVLHIHLWRKEQKKGKSK